MPGSAAYRHGFGTIQNVLAERQDQRSRQWDQSVFGAFARLNMDDMLRSLDVLDSQRKAFADPHPRVVDQLGHE
jgi:hypothetical protein